ncbi:Protein CBG26698 [Caenorhabditis briggsae]|uniref:Protein CBG26698 n=1 Tax=Caenorhabditis briggsae TaxID=6238 RepID=B6IE68_CAEBR|nr:Protein CBG26698 [Caenorhabditis briggsae]CAS01132.1 Protein CBG26698 [Caenorhabditis briggsae]
MQVVLKVENRDYNLLFPSFSEYSNPLIESNRQEELSKLYKDAVIGKRFGMGILRTLCSIRTFVTLIIDGKSPKVLKKFAVKGLSNDKACIALQQLLRQEDPSEMNRKKTEFANGFMVR